MISVSGLVRRPYAHWAPPNAASFLIGHACKLVYHWTGAKRFFAYSDPSAGEYGGVYQACGWAYLGQGLRGGRTHRTVALPPGADSADPAAWKSTRNLRAGGRELTLAQAVALGWKIGRRPAKHVYAVHVGRERKKWMVGLAVQPYPKPDRELALRVVE